jgi:ABC-type glycerol-3-phosphate transport system substrate-binding protein
MPTLRFFRPALLAAFVLSACGQSNATATLSPAATSSPPGGLGRPTVTTASASTPTAAPTPLPRIALGPERLRGVSLQVWRAFSGAAADVFTDQLAQFNTLNEWGIIVYQSAYGDYASLFEAVDAGLASDPRPDLTAALPEQAFAWQARGAVVDLNPYLYDPTWGLSASEIADIPAVFWTRDAAGGQRLGAPAERSARFLFYNQTWARELGFTSPPASPEEFRLQACAANAFYRQDTVKQNDGYGGWMVNTQPETVLSWLLAFGGGALQDGEIHFSTPENRAALEFLKGLYDEHCAWISTEPNPYESFARRSALFVAADLAEVSRLAETMARLGNSDEWTLLPFPGESGPVLVTSGPAYILLASTPEKQLAAWLFVRWLLTTDNQAQWVQAAGRLPLRFSALDLLGEYRAAHPQWEAAVGYLSLAQTAPPSAGWRAAQYVLSDGTAFVFRTDLAVDKIPSILEEMDATVEELQ